jgi:hypothetical protein
MIENDDESLKLSNQLCFAIYSTAHAFTRIYKPILDPFGLTDYRSRKSDSVCISTPGRSHPC